MRRAVVRRPNNTRPGVWVVENEGVRAVVKDYSTCSLLFRNTFGRFLVWREVRVYRKLNHFRGAPEFYGTIDGLALILQEIPGIPLKDVKKDTRLEQGFFDALRDLVGEIQDRGLAHCDLKTKGNILVGLDGRPYIIDWAAAISKHECRFPPLNRIYQRFLQDDYKAVIKHKLFYRSELVTSEEKARYHHRDRQERAIRHIRDRLRRMIQTVS